MKILAEGYDSFGWLSTAFHRKRGDRDSFDGFVDMLEIVIPGLVPAIPVTALPHG